MEDLATDRIYRLMISQRMRHSDRVEILGETGLPIRHTPELIRDLFEEELARLLRETAALLIRWQLRRSEKRGRSVKR